VGWAQAEFDKEARRVPKPKRQFSKQTGCLILGIAGVIALGALIVLVISSLSPAPLWELLQKAIGR
jgi:hypothetical protein